MRSKSLPAHRTRREFQALRTSQTNGARVHSEWYLGTRSMKLSIINYDPALSRFIRNTTPVCESDVLLNCSSTSAFEVSPAPTDNIRFWCELWYVMIMQLFNKHIWDSHDCIPDVFVYNIIFDGILISSAKPNLDFWGKFLFCMFNSNDLIFHPKFLEQIFL